MSLLTKFVVCVRTDGAEDLQSRKIYRVLPDKTAARSESLRVIDDSNASYLYPQSLFAEIELSPAVENALFNDPGDSSTETGSGKSKPQELTNLRRQLRPLFRENGVVRASLFGSFARGEQTPESDLDILVEFQKGKSLLDLVGLKIAIETKIHRKADVATDAALHPNMRDQILSEAIPIYESKRAPISQRHSRKHTTIKTELPRLKRELIQIRKDVAKSEKDKS